MKKRVYIDSGVLITVYRGEPEKAEKFIRFLDDLENYEFYLSDAVWIEVFPKAYYENRQEEIRCYEYFFNSFKVLHWNEKIFSKAKEIACKYGLKAMDAFHITFAFQEKIDIFLTTERESSPLFRVDFLRVVNEESV